MVGYGANKVMILIFRVLCQSHANRFSREFQKTKIPINNMKLMFLCFKSTTKKCKIFSSLSANEQSKASKSDNTKPWEFMWRDFPNTMLIPISPSKKKWSKEAKIDLLLQLKWMPVLVELTLLFLSNFVKRMLLKAKKDRNSLSSI